MKDVRDPDVVAEIIESLREDDVTAPGGSRASSKAEGWRVESGRRRAEARFAEEENELARLAAGLRVGDEDRGTGAAPSISISASSGASAARDKVSSACAALRAAALATRDGDDDGAEPLLDDEWELVVLSSYARSDTPDAAAALRRVGRRRERELAAAAAVASSPARVGAAGAGANERASASNVAAASDDDPDAIVVASGASTLEAAAAAGKDAGDRTPGGLVSSSRLSSSAALRHLLALEGAKALFDAAIGTYDVSLAYMVGQNSNMDPGEYVPELRRLQAMPPALRRADVDLRLGRHASAVANLLEGGDVAGACEVAARRRLFPAALAAARAEPSADDPDGTPPRTIVARAYAAQLADESRHEDAAVTLLSVGDAADAARHTRLATAATRVGVGRPPRFLRIGTTEDGGGTRGRARTRRSRVRGGGGGARTRGRGSRGVALVRREAMARVSVDGVRQSSRRSGRDGRRARRRGGGRPRATTPRRRPRAPRNTSSVSENSRTPRGGGGGGGDGDGRGVSRVREARPARAGPTTTTTRPSRRSPRSPAASPA